MSDVVLIVGLVVGTIIFASWWESKLYYMATGKKSNLILDLFKRRSG